MGLKPTTPIEKTIFDIEDEIKREKFLSPYDRVYIWAYNFFNYRLRPVRKPDKLKELYQKRDEAYFELFKEIFSNGEIIYFEPGDIIYIFDGKKLGKNKLTIKNIFKGENIIQTDFGEYDYNLHINLVFWNESLYKRVLDDSARTGDNKLKTRLMYYKFKLADYNKL